MAEQIKRDAALSGAVIMMLTSGDRADDVARCKQLGIAAYLLKPVKQSDLFDAIVSSVGLIAPIETAAKHAPLPKVACLDILLAEDSVVNQKLAIGLLEKRGHRIQIANNGCEAVEAVERRKFDLVLMDVQMPEMDGLEATAVIRRREQQTASRIPIIAMTAHAMKGDRELCLEAGMDDYISKPIRPDELYRTIENAAQRSQQPEGGDQPPAANGAVDWTIALKTTRGDRDLLKVIAEAFLEECPIRLGEAHKALDAGDAKTLRRAAHSIKGSCRYFGAEQAFEVAYALEQLGAGDRLGEAEQLGEAGQRLAELEETLRGLTPAIEAFVETGEIPAGPVAE